MLDPVVSKFPFSRMEDQSDNKSSNEKSKERSPTSNLNTEFSNEIAEGQSNIAIPNSKSTVQSQAMNNSI